MDVRKAQEADGLRDCRGHSREMELDGLSSVGSAERFVEVVTVEPGHFVKLRADPHLVVEHQVYQAFTVDQYQPLDRAREVNGVGGEAGGGNEYTAFSFLPGQGAIKRL